MNLTAFGVVETRGAAFAPMCSASVRDLMSEAGFAMIDGRWGVRRDAMGEVRLRLSLNADMGFTARTEACVSG